MLSGALVLAVLGGARTRGGMHHGILYSGALCGAHVTRWQLALRSATLDSARGHDLWHLAVLCSEKLHLASRTGVARRYWWQPAAQVAFCTTRYNGVHLVARGGTLHHSVAHCCVRQQAEQRGDTILLAGRWTPLGDTQWPSELCT